jgi:hypothetical protein
VRWNISLQKATIKMLGARWRWGIFLISSSPYDALYKRKALEAEGRAALENIICALAGDIMPETDIEYYVDQGIFQNAMDDFNEVRFDVNQKLGHGACTPRCLE